MTTMNFAARDGFCGCLDNRSTCVTFFGREAHETCEDCAYALADRIGAVVMKLRGICADHDEVRDDFGSCWACDAEAVRS